MLGKGVFARLESSGRLPTPPAVVVRLLELTRCEDTSAREIAETIAMDPGLSAKILRFVNSPMAGMTREVSSLQQAVALLGLRGVKLMALSFAVLSSKGKSQCAGFNPTEFAMFSVACGVAARSLSGRVQNAAAQEAFVAGLLSQIGRSVLATSLPEEYAAVLSNVPRVPEDLPKAEVAAFGESYAGVGAQVLRVWGLPEDVCRAVEHFRDVDDGSDGHPPMACLLRVAESVANLVCANAGSPVGQTLDVSAYLDLARRLLHISEETSLEALHEIAGEVEEMRSLLELPANSIRPIQEIESDIRERITELSLAMHIENQTMARQQEDLLRRATIDALTGIGNRASFDARLTLELERAARSGSYFALLLIDVDRFKEFNDTHGHQAGDRVLQALAKAMDQSVRKVDFVARYGGEEFAVIVPDTSPEGAMQLAERLRGTVASTPVTWEGQRLSVTMSVGVAIVSEVVDANDTERIIKAADEQLYAAKCKGRNRVEGTLNGKPIVWDKPALAGHML